MSDFKAMKLAADTVRLLSADAIQKAKSGHPGMPMGAADMAFSLWYKYMRHNPKNPQWIARDRFVLSAGHGSMLLYSLLHLFGYGLTMEDLQNFRQWDSLTPGHPEFGHTKGVEVTTGPLGTGFAAGIHRVRHSGETIRPDEFAPIPGDCAVSTGSCTSRPPGTGSATRGEDSAAAPGLRGGAGAHGAASGAAAPASGVAGSRFRGSGGFRSA